MLGIVLRIGSFRICMRASNYCLLGLGNPECLQKWKDTEKYAAKTSMGFTGFISTFTIYDIFFTCQPLKRLGLSEAVIFISYKTSVPMVKFLDQFSKNKSWKFVKLCVFWGLLSTFSPKHPCLQTASVLHRQNCVAPMYHPLIFASCYDFCWVLSGNTSKLEHLLCRKIMWCFSSLSQNPFMSSLKTMGEYILSSTEL